MASDKEFDDWIATRIDGLVGPAIANRDTDRVVQEVMDSAPTPRRTLQIWALATSGLVAIVAATFALWPTNDPPDTAPTVSAQQSLTVRVDGTDYRAFAAHGMLVQDGDLEAHSVADTGTYSVWVDDPTPSLCRASILLPR